MGTSAPTDKIATLSDEEYVGLGRRAAAEVMQLCDEMSKWSITNSGDDHCMIYTRKSELKDAAESMLMLKTEFECTVDVMEDLLSPWRPYRLQWDDLLEDATIIASLDEEVYLVRHLIRKRITLSPRESVDVVKVNREAGRLVFGSCGTSHGSVPPTRGYVRTHQYIGGYILETVAGDRCRMTVLFHADLNLPGPRLISSLADRFKPKLMLENMKTLRTAVRNFPDLKH